MMFGSMGFQSHHGAAIPRRLKRGLLVLLTAHDYAVDLERDRWDFATEITSLQRLGLTNNDFRWLVGKGLVAHAREITRPGTLGRQFQSQNETDFTPKTCFVLTELGLVETIRLRKQAHGRTAAGVGGILERPGISPRMHVGGQLPAGKSVPRWDPVRHELRLGPHLIKAFKLPSPNQETVLTVFEEEGWPVRIDDPLPPRPEIFSKQRLHDTIKSLNRNHQKRLIRFVGDGTGLGVCWEFVSEDGGVLRGQDLREGTLREQDLGLRP